MKNEENEIEEDKMIIKHIITEALFSSKLISDYLITYNLDKESIQAQGDPATLDTCVNDDR